MVFGFGLASSAATAQLDTPSAVGREFLPPPPLPGPVAGTTANVPEAAAPIGLDFLDALAARSNPTLLQADTHVDANRAQALQAGLYPNPSIQYRAMKIGADGTAGEFQGGTVQQEIVTAGKLRLSRAKYAERAETAAWLASVQRLRVRGDVRIHYYQALGRQEFLAIRGELLENGDDFALTARELYNVGQANRAEVHRSNVVIQTRRLDYQMARNDLLAARWSLEAVVGSDLPPGPLAGPLEVDVRPVDYDAALARVLDGSPEVLAALAKLRADQITVERERVEPIPNLVLTAGAGRAFDTDPNQTVGFAMASFSVPIFDRNQGTIRQAQADLLRQRGEVRRVGLDIKRRFADQFRRHLTAAQHVENYRTVILPESRAAYENLLESYRQDRATWATVLDAERIYFEARIAYVENLVTWRESGAIIENYLLSDGLMAPPNPTPPGHIDSTPRPR